MENIVSFILSLHIIIVQVMFTFIIFADKNNCKYIFKELNKVLWFSIWT